MSPFLIAAFLCLGSLVSGVPVPDDGQWRGEGLAESQDWGQWNGAWAPYTAWGTPLATWIGGAAPIGPDGRVVDTPEVAAAKAAHLTAVAGWTGTPWAPLVAWTAGGAPIGPDGRVVNTPEVAAATAAHLAAKAAAGGW